MPDIEEYVDLGEVCEILQCSRWTVQRRVKSGELKAYRIRPFPYRLFLRDEVEALARQHALHAKHVPPPRTPEP